MTAFTADEQRLINAIVAGVRKAADATIEATLVEVRRDLAAYQASVADLGRIVTAVIAEADEEYREDEIASLLAPPM